MVIVYGVTRIDYQPLFGKWARAPPPKVLLGRPDTRDRRKSSLRYYLKTKNILVVLAVSDELTWNLSMLFSRPGKIDCITWRLGRSRSRCFWRGHVVFAVLIPKNRQLLVKIRISDVSKYWSKYFCTRCFREIFGDRIGWHHLKKRNMLGLVHERGWGVWSMALLENRIFSCFGEIVVDRIWWHYVKTKRFCTCCFREITFYRIRWDHLFFLLSWERG